jgi:hypothetical protein
LDLEAFEGSSLRGGYCYNHAASASLGSSPDHLYNHSGIIPIPSRLFPSSYLFLLSYPLSLIFV